MIPPRPTKVREMCFTVHCQKCGHGIILASGYNAESFTSALMIASLKKIGWQFAPTILCRSCACPMEWYQMKEAERIFAKHKRNGGHLALYQAQVNVHYPGKEKEIQRWFETL